jgi:ParB-like chromosome segregation protein Spo0J
LQPIVVDSHLRLVCGFHRLEACRALGWEALPVIVQHLEGAHAKLAEIDENLCRHELSALERGEHTALRKRLYQELRAEADRAEPPSSPRPKKGKAKEADPEAIARAFLAETAQRTGRSRAAVAQDVKIGELDADVRTMLHETPLHKKKNELVALTKMPVDEQREAVARVKAGEAKSVRPKRSNDPPSPGPSAPSSLPAHPFAATLLDLREVTTTLERVVDSWPKDDNADYRELTLRLRAALDHLHDVRKRIESFAPSAAAELDRRAGPPREPAAPTHHANQPRRSPAQPGPRRGPGSRQQRKPTE